MLIYSDEVAQAWNTHNFEDGADNMRTCTQCGLVVPKRRGSMSFEIAKVPDCTGKKEPSNDSADS